MLAFLAGADLGAWHMEANYLLDKIETWSIVKNSYPKKDYEHFPYQKKQLEIRS
jgi:hypothetical protein